MTDSVSPTKDLDSYISGVRGEFESVLADLVQIPTVSSDPERAKDVRRGAEAAAQVLRGFGADAQVVETAGHPVVWGKWALPLPTLHSSSTTTWTSSPPKSLNGCETLSRLP